MSRLAPLAAVLFGLACVSGGAGAQKLSRHKVIAQLTDSSAEARERAATEFAAQWGRKAVEPAAAAALRRSIEMGNAAAAAYLLLGAAGDAESAALLQRRQESPEGEVKWDLSSQPVSEALAAMVARMQQAPAEVKPLVLEAAAKPEPPEARFLLDALPFLDDREVIARLGHLLDDTRPLPNEQRRRLCDYALTALATRLELKLSFEVRDFGRYTAEQFAEVKKAMEAWKEKGAPGKGGA